MRNLRAIAPLAFVAATVFVWPAQAQDATGKCAVSAWGEWTQCTQACGGGTRARVRTIVSAEKGAQCPPLQERAACNTQRCAPSQECTMTAWGSWSKCSVECGGGTQSRTRAVVAGSSGSARCPSLVETQKCNSQACAPATCQVGPWGEWSACTATCGGGMRTRSRTVVSAAKGAQCPVLSEAAACNVQACAPR
jgi:complement component 6